MPPVHPIYGENGEAGGWDGGRDDTDAIAEDIIGAGAGERNAGDDLEVDVATKKKSVKSRKQADDEPSWRTT